MPTKYQQEVIRSLVEKGLCAQFDVYSWEDMIDDCNLTEEEKAWAKQHLTYKVEAC